MKSVLFLGPVFYGLTAAIPTFAVLLFGADAVNAFLSVMPSWFTTGLSIAAGILPVVGLAMLLSFMPMKKFIAYAIVGFVRVLQVAQQSVRKRPRRWRSGR